MPESRGEDRQAFFERIRKPLGRAGHSDASAAPTSEPPPEVPDELARLASRDDDLVGTAVKQIKASGIKPRRCRRDDLHARLGELLDEPKP